MIDNKGYTLRFPFRLAPRQKFSNLDEPYVCEHSGLNLKLGEQSGLYFYSVGVFPDEEAGKAFIPRLWAGLMWALLHLGLSPEAKLSPQDITYTEDPWKTARNVSKSLGLKGEKLDAILDGSLPAVYGSDKVVRVRTRQQVSLSPGFPADKTSAFVGEVLALPHPECVVTNGKLKVALDLYNAFFRETSANARFLSLNMALEALAPSDLKHKCVSEAIDRWVAEAKKLQEAVQTDSEEWHAYDSLVREIGFRKEKSIRSSIRNLVLSTLRASDPDAADLSRQAVQFYDLRSRLVHDGHVQGEDLGQAATKLREIVFHVLKARFIQVASGE
ncbi:MAG: hypothetical protein ACNY01_09325 [Desulfobacteria bacterium]